MTRPSRPPCSTLRALPAALPIAAALLLAPATARAAEDGADDTASRIEALQGQLQALQTELARLRAQVDAERGAGEGMAVSAAPAASAASASTPAASAVSATMASAPAPAAAKAEPETTISWRGAPEFARADGWRFKVRGRFQYDAGYVENPGHRLPGDTYGFNSRARRIRLGVEGWFPGDVQYKAEMDFANGAIGYGDVILYWQPKGKIYSIGIGNYDTFQNLEQPSSSRYISFMERAQMVEAFDHTRRVGIFGALGEPDGEWRLMAGVFNDRIRTDTVGAVESTYGNDDWLVGARALYMPKIGEAQLHFGINVQDRHFQHNNLNQTYQTRPFTQTIDQRLVSTGSIAAHGDRTIGAEAAAILGPLHLTGEIQQLRVRAIRPGEELGEGRVTRGLRYAGDPKFLSWYAEAGFFLTGERRGYRNGLWDRTHVLRPVSDGGPGAIQVNLRYDVLDLNDRVAGGDLIPPDYVAGGRQTGMLASLIWQPMDYIRFTLEYARVSVRGGPRASVVDPSGATPDEVEFNTNVLGARAQFDF